MSNLIFLAWMAIIWTEEMIFSVIFHTESMKIPPHHRIFIDHENLSMVLTLHICHNLKYYSVCQAVYLISKLEK